MNTNRSIAKFLVLFLLSVGFFVLSSQDAKADGMCQSTRNWCYADCDTQRQTNLNNGMSQAAANDAWDRCNAVCNANELGCLADVAWDDWLYFINLNIGENFQILNEPSPYCANMGDVYANCGIYETAVEVEACILMAQQTQAHFYCPQ